MRTGSESIEISEIVTTVEAGLLFADNHGYPVTVSPFFTLTGSKGRGTAEDRESLEKILRMGLDLSPVGEAQVYCVRWRQQS